VSHIIIITAAATTANNNNNSMLMWAYHCHRYHCGIRQEEEE